MLEASSAQFSTVPPPTRSSIRAHFHRSFTLGALTILFFQCMAALLNPPHRREEGIKRWLVFYTMAMFSFVTVYTAVNLHILSISFIDNRQDVRAYSSHSSGPLSYRNGIHGTALGLVPNVMFNLSNWLADGLLVSSLFDACPLTRVPNVCSAPRYTVVILSTPQPSGLPPFPASCTLPPWVRILVLHKPAAMLWTNATIIGMGIAMLSIQPRRSSDITPVFPQFGIPYLSISVSLNVLLTLMIVIRLALHARNFRTATGSLVGISGLCKVASIMLVESCALFAVSSLVVVVALARLGNDSVEFFYSGLYIVDIFFPILAETQVRAFPQPQPLG